MKMNAKEFTARIDAAAYGKEITDPETPGLKARVRGNGRASWSLQIGVRKERRRFRLGMFPAMSLAEARKAAIRLRAQVDAGADPIRDARAAVKADAERRAQMISVEEFLGRYAALHLAKIKSGDARRRELLCALRAHLGRPMVELHRRHLQDMIDAKVAEGKITRANRLYAALKHFIRFAYRREIIDSDISGRLERGGREKPRERIVTLEEMRAIYQAVEDEGVLWSTFMRILILTGQRRGDVAKMEWSHVDFEKRQWAIPPGQAKNRQAHIVHLSEPTCALLGAYRELDLPGPLVFSTNGRSVLSTFRRMKARVDDALRRRDVERGVPEDRAGVSDWRLHDFRTAFATAMAEAGEDEGVIDRILNHVAVASSASVVARVYNRAKLLPQRARVLDRWAEMITGDAGSVTRLDTRRAERASWTVSGEQDGAASIRA